METKEKILEIFEKSNNPLKTGEVVEISGLEKSEVSKAIKSLKNDGKIYSPKRCYYSIVE
ncbi:MAG: winged helix-turn-helix transcriptional regulator [Tissierellales bacterium]|nr:winged helix-turn-helix transcriptional regulator [Tissierellales bacterium]